MSRVFKYFRRRGFTLVELLVVIAIIGILVAIVLPAVSGALFRGQLTATMANGKSIVTSIFAKDTESIYISTLGGWPRYSASDNAASNAFSTSTAFFTNLVLNGTLSVNYSFFGAKGVPPPSAGGFQGGNNAWCVVGDVSETFPETSPALFTKNLWHDKSSGHPLSESLTAGTPASGPIAELGSVAPFDKKGFVFVSKGGGGYALQKEMLAIANFTNLFQRADPVSSQNLTNRVLRP
jgi:prepilin-type N-terminal cleavage/methylation domain-containing protein